MQFSVNSLAMVLATAITTTMAAPTNNLALRQDDGVTRCKVEAQASHSYGGGGPGQVPIDSTSGAIYCYDVNNNRVFYNTDANVNNFNGATNTVSGADCHTQGDVTFHTAYNTASNHFEICTITYNGADTEGVVTSNIDSGTVSVSTSYCTIYIPC